jgi:molybdopterin-guanine dinucleotide biosynthesis protein A
MKSSELTGIILAGGKSRRLGMNKATIELKGKKLIEYPIHLLEQYCHQIIISSNQPLPLPYPIVSDVMKEQGPMVGIYSCLLRSKTPYNIVLSCDMPLLKKEMIALLINRIERNKIIVPVHDDNLMEPLCAIYPTHTARPMFESILQKQLTLHEFILAQPHAILTINNKLKFWSEDLFFNINTPEELEKIQHS